MKGTTEMHLEDAKTGKVIQQGDTVELRDNRFIVSFLDPAKRIIYLIDAEADKDPFPIGPAAIGARFAA